MVADELPGAGLVLACALDGHAVAGAHHEDVGLPGLPARPSLGLSDEDEADLEAIIDAWLESRLSDGRCYELTIVLDRFDEGFLSSLRRAVAQ